MKMQMRFMRKLALTGALALATTGLVYAQSTTQGGISGTVFDATDAAVPNATVTIHNDGTAAEITLKTDGSGFYRAPQLAPGTYTVTVTADGFNVLKSNSVIVQVNSVTELDPHLTTGATQQVVEVTAAVPVLNFESPTYGGHLNTNEIESIPINNRRWSSLTLLTPGVTVDSAGFGLISFRAISPLLNNVEVDGADDNQAFFSEERGRTRAGYSTAQVAVREFQVNTGVYSAEFGRAVGGVVNSVTKSGTNSLHGEVYFYNRDDGRAAFQPLASNTTFNPATNSYVTTPYKPKDKRNQYGFGVGGPVIKDKLFWFYSFDQFKRNFPGTAKANNPNSFFAAPTSATLATLQSRLTLAGITTPAATVYNNQLQSLLSDLGPVARRGDQTINTPKLDWQINGKHHVSFLYHRLRWDSPGGVQTQSTNNYAIDSFGNDFVKLDYGVAKLDSQITSRLVNELRFQYGRELNNEGSQTPSAYTNQNLTSLGLPTSVSLLGAATNIGFNLGIPYYSFRVAYPDERKWQIGDTASIQLGKHAVKFGEDIVHNYDLQNNVYQSNGAYNYSSIVNYITDLVTKSKTCDASGSGVGSAAAGSYPCYQSFAQGFGPPVYQLTTTDYGFFVQDDWKLTPQLTVNLGVRYDYESLPSPQASLVTLQQTGNHPSDKNNIAPRLGFAWDPYGQGKTVVRGGYGMYYGRIFNALLLNAFLATGSPSNQNQYSFSSSTPGAPLLPTIAAAPPPPAALGPSIQYLANNLQNPMTHQFNLTVQQDLGWSNVLSVSYIGALGRQLINYLNTNLDPTQRYTANYTVAGTNGNCGPLTCGTVVPVSVYASKVQTGKQAGQFSYVTPNPSYNAVTGLYSNVNSSYHAITAEVTNRSWKLLTFDVNYTWSHALDFNQNQFTAAGTNNWFDPFGNARANYGNSNQNVPHRLVAWGLLNLPGTSNSLWKWVANGWSLKPLLQVQSGLPYSALVNGTAANQCYSAGCLEIAGSGLAGTGVTYIPQVGRNAFRYPVTVLNDLRAEKDFSFREKYSLQLIGEAFNVANHQNITGLNTTAYNVAVTQGLTAGATSSTLNFAPTFGSVTASNSNFAYGTRQVQLALRLLF